MISRLPRLTGKPACANVKLLSTVSQLSIVSTKHLFMRFAKTFPMKRYFHISILWLCAMSTSLTAQVFSIYELDQYKDGEPVPGSEVKTGAYADINATLVLKFDKEALAEEMLSFSGGNDSITHQLEILESVLRSQTKIFQAFQGPVREDLTTLNQLAELMSNYFDELGQNEDIRQLYNQYSADYRKTYSRREIRQAGTQGVPYREVYIMSRFDQKLAELAANVGAILDDSNVRFLLTGRLITDNGSRPIKLSDDFDKLRGDVFIVPRWQMQLKPRDLQQLATIDSLSRSLNALVESKGENLKLWLEQSLQADDCFEQLRTEFRALPQTVSALGQSADTELKSLVDTATLLLDQLKDQYTSGQTIANGITGIDVLENFSGELNNTAQNIDGFLQVMDNRLMMSFSTLRADTNVVRLENVYDNCRAQLDHDRRAILGVVQKLGGLFKSAHKSSNTADRLGPKIKRLNYDAVPKESWVDLRNTGRRKNGDEVRITASLEQIVGNDTLRTTIQRTSFKVQQIGVYSVVKPMLLLANPVGSGENVNLADSKFQFGPSYSILFKFGSRNRRSINEVWQPAFGVNFGTLDFDTEGTPEFSAAAEFTFLKDYFSVGYGYNFGVSEPYFMLGFRLPVGAIPLPLFNEVEVNQPRR